MSAFGSKADIDQPISIFPDRALSLATIRRFTPAIASCKGGRRWAASGAIKKGLRTGKGRDISQSPTRAAPSRRGFIKAVAVAGIAAPAVLRSRGAYAAYPDRPIKFVVANTPGGPSDIVGRLVAAALQQSTGKTFIIENRGGAGGNLGMEYVAHSDPDGYTFLLGTTAFSVNYSLYNSLPFDPMKDFVAVSDVGGSPNIYLVKPDLPAKTMKDFVALARSSPEKFNASVPPIGTTPQLQMALLKWKEKLPNSKRWCSRVAATRSKPCSPAPSRSVQARWRPRWGTSRAARCAGSRSAPSSAGRICPTCRP